jgi:hypothetical protein
MNQTYQTDRSKFEADLAIQLIASARKALRGGLQLMEIQRAIERSSRHGIQFSILIRRFYAVPIRFKKALDNRILNWMLKARRLLKETFETQSDQNASRGSDYPATHDGEAPDISPEEQLDSDQPGGGIQRPIGGGVALQSQEPNGSGSARAPASAACHREDDSRKAALPSAKPEADESGETRQRRGISGSK